MDGLIQSIFSFNPEAPLLFTQLGFWIFFLVVFTIYSFIYHNIQWRNAFLFLVSAYFYYKSGGVCIFLLLFAITFNYYWGIFIDRKKHAKLFLVTGIITNLSVLLFFKYAYFFTGLINQIFSTDFKAINIFAVFSNQVAGTNFNILHIILPVGISFFTFQAISYLVDVYQGKMEPIRSYIEFGFFKSFFPQLVAGPIVRAIEFAPQLKKHFYLNQEGLGTALYLIMAGLIKKMLVSDYISVNFVDRVFDNPLLYTGFENAMAVVGYAIQIYCDFSGYTDIAIGIALLFGFRLPLNFNSPYKAQNITDFWRRWHITLSTWLRDYLYIPLGGNRKGKTRTYINLFLTMLLGGLWHGAAMRFVIWGGLHGLGLAVHKIWMKYFPVREKTSWSVRFLSMGSTFVFVCFTWIFFRATDMEGVRNMLGQIFTSFGWQKIGEIVLNYYPIFLVITLAFVLHWLPVRWKYSIRNRYILAPSYLKIAFALVAVFIITQIKTSVFQPFIYFQF